MDSIAVHLRHLDDAWAHKWESLSGVLAGVSEEEAAWQAPCYAKEEREDGWPAPGSIRWQVAHIAFCKRHYADCIRRLGEPEPPSERFKPVTGTFAQDRAELDAAHADERAAIVARSDADLPRLLFNRMALGEFLAMLVRHDVWHAGQIAVARRLWRTSVH